MGPHGLFIGATGSGKSRAAAHPGARRWPPRTRPRRSTSCSSTSRAARPSLGLDGLPHVAAVITNLADELSLVDRMQDALAGEMQPPPGAAARRRQLRHVARLRAGPGGRRAARAAAHAVRRRRRVLRAAAARSPTSSTCSSQIGRLGRSLGVHLLLASQRLEEGKAARAGHPPVLPDRAARRSRRRSRGPCSACRTRTSCRRCPGSGYLKVDTDRWSGSRPRTCPAPYRPPSGRARARPGAARDAPASLHRELSSRTRCSRARHARPAGRPGSGRTAVGPRGASEPRARRHRRAAARPGPAGARGVAAAAGRPADARRAAAAADRRPRTAGSPRAGFPAQRAARGAGRRRRPALEQRRDLLWADSPARRGTWWSSAGRSRASRRCCAR